MRWHRYLYFPSAIVLVLKQCGIRTDFDRTEGNHGAIDFVYDTVDLLDIVRVRHDLITGDDVLQYISVSDYSVYLVVYEAGSKAQVQVRGRIRGKDLSTYLIDYHSDGIALDFVLGIEAETWTGKWVEVNL